MKIALTGGTGLLGKHLLPALRSRGHTVRVLVRPRPGRTLEDEEGLRWIEGGLDEIESLDVLVRNADVILHAAFSRPEEPPPEGRSAAEHYGLTNIMGTMRLLERTAAVAEKQLIYVSSLAVYGADPNLDPRAERFVLDEDFPLWPRELYGALRAAVEKMVVAAAHAYGFNTSVFRLGHVLGAREDRARTSLAAVVDEAIEHGELRTRSGSYVITVEDCAEILAEAVGDARLRGEVYNTFDRWLDHADLAPILSALLGRPVTVACDPAPEPRSPIRGDRIRARYDRFRTDEGIRELLESLIHSR